MLKRSAKGATPEAMGDRSGKAKQAGLTVAATVILGLGGQAYWREHIDGTADLVDRVELEYLSALELMIDPRSRGG